MSIDTWAAANGETPKPLRSAEHWFAQHPDLKQQAHDAYHNEDRHWSWAQIHRWLRAEHGYPFAEARSVHEVCG